MPRQPARHAAQSELAVTFQHFADRRCGSYAPLYRRLGAVVAANTELLAIAATATAGQSVPDLMLAAVHYLIAREPTHPLARYYPTLTTQPRCRGSGQVLPRVLPGTTRPAHNADHHPAGAD